MALVEGFEAAGLLLLGAGVIRGSSTRREAARRSLAPPALKPESEHLELPSRFRKV